MTRWLLTILLLAALVLACSILAPAPPGNRITPSVPVTSTRITGEPARPVRTGGYQSTLVDGLTPTPIEFGGRKWRVNAGSTWNRDQDFAVRINAGSSAIRFEIRGDEQSRSINDKPHVRRAELSTSLYGDRSRLPNGKALWGAYSFNHLPWGDPAGMKELWGGVYGQIHMGSEMGGSPAFAIRRKSDGRLWITTRGEFDREGTDRYLHPLAFGQRHDLVYAVTLDPRRGNARVWLDGRQIVDVTNVSIGSSHAGSYWAFGLYFSGGITGPVIAEYSNVIAPGATPLYQRIAAPPTWSAR